jgi:predicted RNA-binding Zn-ribbon protein involved in translation (DUF1610 family)
MGELKKALRDVGNPRILILDIETAPLLVEVWRLTKNDYISASQMRKPGRILSFAYQWAGEKRIGFHSEWTDGQDQMIQKAWDLLNEADILIAYNSPFDIKHLQAQFILRGMQPPAPWKNIDLLRVVRSEFGHGLPSNRLDYVCKALGIGAKTSHEGHGLWTRVQDGDEKARKLMEKYNKQDVRITTMLYFHLRDRGWIKGHPHVGLYTGVDKCCPACGSENLIREGWIRTPVTLYAGVRCGDCGTVARLNHMKQRTETRPVR